MTSGTESRKAESSAARAAKPIEQLRIDCDEIARTKAGDTHKIASLLQEMILDYYTDVRKQAQQSFYAALVAAAIGVVFFIYAVWNAMSPGGVPASKVGLGAGGLAQFISAVNFYLYFRAARQFASFHICLERTNRYLLANTMCENLAEPARNEMRRRLIEIIASAPMLTLDVVTGDTGSQSGSTRTPDDAAAALATVKQL